MPGKAGRPRGGEAAEDPASREPSAAVCESRDRHTGPEGRETSSGARRRRRWVMAVPESQDETKKIGILVGWQQA
jgi:hypothetical protein